MSTSTWIRGALALLSLAVLPSCDQFEDVTVPAVDTTPPSALAAVWRQHVYEEISHGASPLHYEVDFDEYYMLIGAGVDSGGTKKVTFEHEYITNCRKGNLGQHKYGLLAPMVETQAGGVGQTVSNGVWTGPLVRLSNYASCNPGWTVISVAYSWRVVAEDFHGNTNSHGWATVYGSP